MSESSVVLEDEVLQNNPPDEQGEQCPELPDNHQKQTETIETQLPLIRLIPPPPKRASELNQEDINTILDNAGVSVFRDADGEKFASFPHTSSTGSYLKICRLKSEECLAEIMKVIRRTHSGTPQPSALKAAIKLLIMKAVSVPEIRLGNRFHEAHGSLWIDLVTEDHQLVKLDANGWEIVQQTRPLFRRHSHQKPQVIPLRGGDHKKLFDFMELPDPEVQLLVTAWILASFFSNNREIPILFVTGGQGSGKTTICRMIVDVLDPSSEPTLGEISNRELDLILIQHAVPCMENVSKINRSRADRYCRITTGSCSPRRKLYSDSDMIHVNGRRPLLMNGLVAPGEYSDFLDRAILIPLVRRKNFLSRHQFDADFQRAKPEILGGFLDLLVIVLEKLDSVSPTSENRMADFTHFGRAVAVALGKQPEEFDRYYRDLQKPSLEQQLEAKPWIRVFLAFAEDLYQGVKEWEGTVTELSDVLKAKGTFLKLHDALKDLPKRPDQLSRQLMELAPALSNEGVVFEKIPRKGDRRGVLIYKRSLRSSSVPQPSQDQGESLDHQNISTGA